VKVCQSEHGEGRKPMTTRATIWLVLVMLVILIAPPAYALVEDSGSINCGGNYVAVRSYSTGETKHYAPSTTHLQTYQNGGSWLVRVTTTLLNNTSWRVTTNGSLNDSGTYAFCWGS
jgi:hypothetical protein